MKTFIVVIAIIACTQALYIPKRRSTCDSKYEDPCYERVSALEAENAQLRCDLEQALQYKDRVEELEAELDKGGNKHSPRHGSWTSKIKSFFDDLVT